MHDRAFRYWIMQAGGRIDIKEMTDRIQGRYGVGLRQAQIAVQTAVDRGVMKLDRDFRLT